MNEYVLYLVPILALSVIVNVFLFWFARKSSGRLTIVASNIDEIMQALENFKNHLETLYEMETFYGDETLHSVLMHARGITEFLSEFEDVYELSEELSEELPEEAEEEWEEADDREESGSTTSTAEKEKKKTAKKAVFYSGS
jgi:aspartate/tyrosine/aromatic aminotransferase